MLRRDRPKRQPLMGGLFFCPMCNWLADAINFLFPEPAEVDIDGIEVDSSIAEFCREVEGQASVVLRQPHDWYAPLPEPPPMFRAEPAVLEAELVIQGRSISSAIPGRVMR